MHADRGDVIKVRGDRSHDSRMGVIVDVGGPADHQHFIVRWDDGHTSYYLPAQGVSIVHRSRGLPTELLAQPGHLAGGAGWDGQI